MQLYTKEAEEGKLSKYMVAAYKVIGGEKRVISTSKVIYIAAAGGKAGNHKTIKLKKKQLKLKKGKTAKIAASLIAESAKKPVKKYRGKRYESSNTQIASVSGKGTVKGKNKGVCYIYVLAQNGIFKKVKVTVQ